ncbi:MAG: BON domain-containing protein [Stenotrophomonas sp.]|uniref:BON domain-containing protein n=1 Tax=Stenotrophomonas sp. TaxID=69392 RepID=UPI003D6D5F3A
MAVERPDTLIADEVVHTLGQHSQSSQVLVQVKDGQVTLSGDVPDAAAKRDIEKLIAGIQGVHSVRSYLHVDSGNSSFGSPGEAVRDNPDGLDDAQLGNIDLDKDG